ncbi:AAA family ATPase [Nakamurella endophytica]|uniref:YhaN AAA domain-containing protein n=1 Tax=Nakamurella endophytica TaxID=1748367 RepID=A0A917WAW7_9ACTN|nr:AAA family ATPase [Nakamurella endophytica]GGL85422.1 hypothetical protein GCM10011594_01350 [Nakamurella endophytica]
MKLHRLSVDRFRGVRHRELVFPDAGVVVIEGANEAGKSSLVEALDLLLEEKDSATKARVRAVQPVGEDVGTTVEAELSVGPYRFTYRKTWNRGAGTTLSLHAPRPEQLTGSRAHDRVEQLLDEHLDRLLWKALRVLQGVPLEQSGLGDSGSLSVALDRAAGTAAEAGQDLLGAVEAEYLRWHTPTGRPTGPYRQAIERHTAARSATEDARTALAELAAAVDLHELLTGQLAQAVEVAGAAAAALLAAERAVAGLAAVEDERAVTAEVAQRAGHQLRQARADQQVRTGLHRRIDRLAAEMERLQASVEPATGALTEQDGVVAGRESAERTTSAAVDRAAAHAVAARDDLEVVLLLDRHAVLAERVAAARTDILELAAARRALAGHRVDREAVRRLEKVAHARDVALARCEAVAGHLVVRPLAGTPVLVGGRPAPPADPPQPVALTGPVEIEVPGVVQVTVLPGQDAVARGEEAAAASTLLDRLSADLGVTGVEDARRRLAERERDEAAVVQAEHRLTGRLAGDTLGALEAELADLQLQRDRLLGGRGEQPLPDDARHARARRKQAEAAETAARADHRAAVDGLAAARATAAELRVELATTTARLAAAGAESAVAEVELRDARSVASDDALVEAVALADRAWQLADAAAQEADKRWREADPEGVRAARRSAGSRRDAAERARTDLVEQLRDLSARLAVMGEQGRQDLLDAALSAEQAAADELASVRGRARAADLLWRTVQAHRATARAGYVDPFRRRLVALAEVLHGPGVDLEVDADLRVVSRTWRGSTVPFAALSTGAQEQLGLLVRLTAAQLLGAGDGDGGVPVILDDALGHTDAVRLAAMGRVLAEAAPDIQVVLLTCTPERYTAIAGATVLRLDGDPAVAVPATAVAEPTTGAGTTAAPVPATPAAAARSTRVPRAAAAPAAAPTSGDIGGARVAGTTGGPGGGAGGPGDATDLGSHAGCGDVREPGRSGDGRSGDGRSRRAGGAGDGTGADRRGGAVPVSGVGELDGMDQLGPEAGDATTWQPDALGGEVAAPIRPATNPAERPAPGVAIQDPRVARVLAVLRSGGPLTRAEVLARTGLDEQDWTAVRRDLLDSGLVRVTGARRGVRYSA